MSQYTYTHPSDQIHPFLVVFSPTSPLSTQPCDSSTRWGRGMHSDEWTCAACGAVNEWTCAACGAVDEWMCAACGAVAVGLHCTGQRKTKNGPVCVNPFHYFPASGKAVRCLLFMIYFREYYFPASGKATQHFIALRMHCTRGRSARERARAWCVRERERERARARRGLGGAVHTIRSSYHVLRSRRFQKRLQSPVRWLLWQPLSPVHRR